MKRFIGLCLALLLAAQPALPDDLNALARIEPQSHVADEGPAISLRLGMTQAVPFRVSYLGDPYRLILDFNEADFSSLAATGFDRSDAVAAYRSGPIRPGWSRLVLETTGPYLLRTADFAKGAGSAGVLELVFDRAEEDEFIARSGLPDDARIAAAPLPELSGPPEARQGKLRVLIDPGHGGIDPGAEVEGMTESGLMLGFAKELKEILLRSGRIEVALTRTEDLFVPLEARVSAAHAIEADVLLSLHADVVTEGEAQGITIYTLSDEASDIASQKLAERHSREDLLAGVDLSNQGDEIAFVLMDMARTDTAHRTDELARSLVSALEQRVELYKKPLAEAGFSVLKAPDIPSVLVELGFMSSSEDLANLLDPDWRRRAAEGLRDGLVAWHLQDLTMRRLHRQ